MGQALEISRTSHTASELRAAASKCRDGAQVRRMLAIALVLDGDARTEAAEQNGMERQTLRDWVRRYNELGIEGLKSLTSPGRALSDGRTESRIESSGYRRPEPRAR